MATPAPTLITLPPELLLALPDYLDNIEDFLALTSTSRPLHTLTTTTTSPTIFRLAAGSTRTLFQPSPHFLVLAIAPSLSAWARRSPQNASIFTETLVYGLPGLLELAQAPNVACGLTLPQIRALHEKRYTTLNPLSDLVDKCVGHQWYDIPNFWNGGASDAFTVSADPAAAVFQLGIYGGLFGEDVELWVSGNEEARARMLSVETRLEFVKYCFEDARVVGEHTIKIEGQPGFQKVRLVRDDVGVYKGVMEGNRPQERMYDGLQSLWTVVRSTRFNCELVEVLKRAGVEVGINGKSVDGREGWSAAVTQSMRQEHGWRQKLWEAGVMCMGLDGLDMLACARERWRGPDYTETEDGTKVKVARSMAVYSLDKQTVRRLEKLRMKVSRLTEAPARVTVYNQFTYAPPSLEKDLDAILGLSHWT